MNEPYPPTTTPREPLAYQPISGFAIAGFTVGCLFSLIVVACAVAALYLAAPMFLPLWVAGLAALGLALSLVGQWHVQNSDGTRAGARLARWGFWLSLVSGLIYFAYFFVTGLALQSQANAFLMDKGPDSGFFPVLLEGSSNPIQLNAAFLLTRPQQSGQPENEREMHLLYDVPGKDGGSGELTKFREGTFGRVFYKNLAKDAKIELLAAQDWDHKKRSYKIYAIYRIKTKEIEFDMQMAVASAESAGQGRKWFLNLAETREIHTPTFTPLGQGMVRLRQSARGWLEKRLFLAGNDAESLNVKQADQTPWDVLIANEKKRQAWRELIHQAFIPKTGIPVLDPSVLTQADEPGKWEQVDSKIRLGLMFRFKTAKSQDEQFKVEGYAMIESRQPINPENFMAGDPAPDWQLVSFVLTMMARIDDKKP